MTFTSEQLLAENAKLKAELQLWLCLKKELMILL
jgi:hypothetical protein